jgi:hypothetical protein
MKKGEEDRKPICWAHEIIEVGSIVIEITENIMEKV